MAKCSGGRWLLRFDDLDTPRQVPGMADDIMATLEAFALLWDGPVTYQSRHREAYCAAFETLARQGVLYPCGCSRREIAQSSSAPHHDDDGIPYAGSCRGGMKDGAPLRSWRVRAPEGDVCFFDRCRGPISQSIDTFSGDFVVRRGDGEFAYQLAVVVDDHLTGVTQVVRGEDLLSSTPRQILLHRLLSLPVPDYCHLPLVTGSNGSKLSKRDNLVSSHLATMVGKEAPLLVAILRFLGMLPPPELTGYSCTEILAWGVAHFSVHDLPERGGVLVA